MKIKGSTADLGIAIPPRRQNEESRSISRSDVLLSPKELRSAAPELNDISATSGMKTMTQTTLSKLESAGIWQSSRNTLKTKASAPNLRSRKLRIIGTSSSKAPKRLSSSEPNFRRKSSAPDLRGNNGGYTSSVKGRSPPHLHKGPGPGHEGFNGKNSSIRQGPRFMSGGGYPMANPSRFCRGSQIGAPKLPSIIGVAPSRMKTKKRADMSHTRSSRSMQMMRVFRHSELMAKCRGITRNFDMMKMAKRVHGYTRLIRAGARKTATEIENRPIYQLREMKRASVMLSLPKAQKSPFIEDPALSDRTNLQSGVEKPTANAEKNPTDPVHGASTDSPKESSLSVSSALGCTSPDIPSTSTVSRSDNYGIRPSLLPYRDWLDIMESSANPFSDNDSDKGGDDDDDASEELTPFAEPPPDSALDTLEDRPVRMSLIPFRDWTMIFNSNRNTLDLHCSSYAQHILLSGHSSAPSAASFASPTGINRSHPFSPFLPILSQGISGSPTGDELNDVHTISPRNSVSSSVTASVMVNSSYQDPFVDISTKGKEILTRARSQIFSSHQEEADGMISREGSSSTMRRSKPALLQENYHSLSPPINPRADTGLSRIPRIHIQKRTTRLTLSAQRPTTATPEHHSSSPAPGPRRSADRFRSNDSSSSRFSGGIRMVEKTEDLHRRLTVSSKPASEELDSSSVSSFGCSTDPDELANLRPTGLTGEHRIRPKTRTELLERYGAQLTIASSAERIILGGGSAASEHSVQSATSTKSHGKRALPRSEHVSFRHVPSDLPLVGEISDSKLGEGPAHREPRETPNFCRLHLPSDSRDKVDDASRRELDTCQCPMLEPNSASLHTEGETTSGLEDVPPVPIIPSLCKNGSTKVTGSSTEVYEGVDLRTNSPYSTNACGSSLPHITLRLSKPGPETGSHGTQDETSNDAGTAQKASSARADDTTREREEYGHTSNGNRLPESKSTRMFDSFRSIFIKSKLGAERGAPSGELLGNSSTIYTRSIPEGVDARFDQATKAKPRWSKSTRNLRADNVSIPVQLPAQLSLSSPASHLSTPAPQSHGHQGGYTPSFARPTQATRTRAAARAKQLSVTQEVYTNRMKVLTPSTGSPSRPARISKRNQVAVLTPSLEPGQEGPSSSGKDTPYEKKLADSGRIGVDNVQEEIDSLCAKICDDSVPMRRANYLRLVLELQQQLSDYKSVEKETRDLESLLAEKKSDKGLALNSLIQYLDQIHLQLKDE